MGRFGRRRALAAIAAVFLAGGLVHHFQSANVAEPSRPYPSGLLTELKALRVDGTGLFMEPSREAGPPDLVTSAYVNAVLLAAGEAPLVAKPGPAERQSSGSLDDPLWRNWAMARLGGRRTMTEMQFNKTLDSTPRKPSDAIGFSGALIEAWCPGGPACDLPKRGHELRERVLGLDAASKTSSYLMWRQAENHRSLHLAPLDTTHTSLARPTALLQVEDFLDLFGWVQLNSARMSPADRQSIVDLIRPALRFRASGREMETSYLVKVWRAVGGSSADLQGVVSEFRARVDPKTSLVRSYVEDQGNLAATYEVARIAEQDFASLASDRTAGSLRAMLDALPGGTDSLVERIKIMSILKQLGQATSSEVSAVSSAALSFLSKVALTRHNVEVMSNLVSAQEALGGPVPKLRATPFAATTLEEKFFAYRLLGLSSRLDNQDEIEAYYAELIRSIDRDTKVNEHNTKFVIAGFSALIGVGTNDGGSQFDWFKQKVNAWQGCGRFAYLFASNESTRPCSLGATRELLYDGLAYSRKES